MPWKIRKNWPEGWATTRFSGKVTTDEIIAARAEIADDPERVPELRMVMDFEQVTELELTPARMRRLAALWSGDPARPPDDSWRLGLVASNPVQFGLFRMFEQLRTRIPGQIRVFEDRARALEWAGIDEGETMDDQAMQEPATGEPATGGPAVGEPSTGGPAAGEPSTGESSTGESSTREAATLGGGCFWCLEAVFAGVDGVLSVQSGYAGGHAPKPSYHQVCAGGTGHAEVVQVVFDPSRISYDEILRIYFTIHDPTTPDRQGADVGHHYRSIILYHSPAQQKRARQVMAELEAEGIWGAPLVTELEPLEAFHAAEPEHDRYFERNPDAAYCQFVVEPKVARARAAFAHRFGS